MGMMNYYTAMQRGVTNNNTRDLELRIARLEQLVETLIEMIQDRKMK